MEYTTPPATRCRSSINARYWRFSPDGTHLFAVRRPDSEFVYNLQRVVRFGWPGVGRYAVDAVITSDYAAIQGFVVTMAIIYVVLNLMVDILNTVVDPRVRYED